MQMNVSVRDLENHLSEYLRRVSAGESLVVLRRGKPVAEIIAPRSEGLTPKQRMQRLVDEGIVRLPRRRKLEDFEPIRVRGEPVSQTLLEDRE